MPSAGNQRVVERPNRRLKVVRPALAAVLACALSSGCAAITNPVANGIPPRLLPPELLGESREALEPIPLTYLRQKPPEEYRLSAGDVLGVYIEGVLGQQGEAPPVNFPDVANLPPALGFPIPVRENGTVPLPLVEPVPVEGLTIAEAEKVITDAYRLHREILQPGRERIIVTLVRPRQVRVLVIRQDSPGQAISIRTGGTLFGAGRNTGAIPGGTRRGTGAIVDLPAYENDVLHALAATGGLPGSDADNEVVIQRGYFDSSKPDDALLDQLHALDGSPLAGARGEQIVRIPLRLPPGAPPPFEPDDVVLRTGDILFIEARDAELFYTGGLLPAGEFLIPRDYDLDVVEAVAQIGGPLVNGGFGGNNLSGSVIAQGIGFPSPSQLTVLRRTPGGRQVVIHVDLNRALRDPRESLLVQPGDILILQETPGEAIARYFSQNFNFTIFSRVIQTSRTTGTATLSVP